MSGMQMRICPHGFHHPYPFGYLDYPHSCDGCWCEGMCDRRDYPHWPLHTTDPHEKD